ncbi:MAG: AIPR family protein [Chloroflexi bacterium]|nr:AIPR family protein [Chloroflexota bacterium]
MLDIVLDGFVDDFAKSRGVGHLKDDQLFEAFTASLVFRKYHQADIIDLEDSVLSGGSGDGGLDAVAILVNGRIARAEEDIRYFEETGQRLDVEFVFIQAKTSTSFRSSDIGNFVFGIEQFFVAVLGDEPKIRFNSEVEQRVDLARFIYRQTIKMRDNPTCFLYYATAGKWNDDPDPAGRLQDGVERLRKMTIFSAVNAIPLDAELLKENYRELERAVVKRVELSRAAVFPRIEGVDEAYIGLLSGDQFIQLVTTNDGLLNRELFYDNVRDFQGHNPVNTEINHTLADEQLRYNFPLLNNGVTLVAREISRQGDLFTISDFQIVNGCQTTHILFQNRDNVFNANTFIPVKIVATTDRQVITEVIKATNRQTAVLPEALESLTPFHKELEDFYATRESERRPPDRIYYERRSKQYVADNINTRNIVSLTGQIKSFIAMFLNEPQSHPRYYGELLRAYEGRIFANDHKPEPYYTSGITLLSLERWLNSSSSHRDIRQYKYQMLMILRSIVTSGNLPRLNSNAIQAYSLQIVEAIRDPQRGEELFESAAELVRTTLSKFGGRSGERNPPHRLRVFTDLLNQSLSSNASLARVSAGQGRRRINDMERGKLIWFDGARNYGFIERQGEDDLFVHVTEIGEVPWHLRVGGVDLQYKVAENLKSPGMLMASEVRLSD